MKKIYLFFSIFVFIPFYIFSQSIALSTDQINFGMLYYGNSDSVLVEISNVANEDLQIEEPIFFDYYKSSPFYVNEYPSSIPAGQTASFYIVFKPIHNMVHNSEVVIVSNRGAAAIDLLGDCKYPQSYYDATYNLLDEELEQAFKILLTINYTDLGYNDARDKMFMEIDNKKVNGQGASENTITRVYLGTDIVGFSSRPNAQSTFNVNTEHTYPQGFFNQASPMRADLHHLYVADANANNVRANYAFGNVVSNVTWQSGGSKLGKDQNGVQVFEPRDDHKGRAARAILYFLLRYQNYGNHVTASYEKTMREWCFQVMPNAVDIKRNNDVFIAQKNRNPFIDYPQYLHRIYNLRGYENRPQAGYISFSTSHIDFGDVSATGDETYAVVFTNYGNATLHVNEIEITENSSNSFIIEESLQNGIAIAPGESVNVTIACTAVSSNEDLNANMTFTTTAANETSFSIPITASFATYAEWTKGYEKIILYPNPASDYLIFKNLDKEIKEIRLYDVSGRTMTDFYYGARELNISHLPSGLYQVVVTLQNGDLFTKKIMKR